MLRQLENLLYGVQQVSYSVTRKSGTRLSGQYKTSGRVSVDAIRENVLRDTTMATDPTVQFSLDVDQVSAGYISARTSCSLKTLFS